MVFCEGQKLKPAGKFCRPEEEKEEQKSRCNFKLAKPANNHVA